MMKKNTIKLIATMLSIKNVYMHRYKLNLFLFIFLVFIQISSSAFAQNINFEGPAPNGPFVQTTSNEVFFNCASIDLSTGQSAQLQVSPETHTYVSVTPAETSLLCLPDDAFKLLYTVNAIDNTLDPGSYSEIINTTLNITIRQPDGSDIPQNPRTLTDNISLTVTGIPVDLSIVAPDDVTFAGEEGGPFTPVSNQVTLSGSCDSDILEDTTLNITFSANENWIVVSPSPTPICSNNSYSQTYTISVDNNIADTFSSGNYSGNINYTVTQGNTDPVTVTAQSTVNLDITALIPNELTADIDNDIMTYTGVEGGPFSPGSNQVILSGSCDSDILEDTTLNITFSANENWIVVSPSPTPICSNNSYSQTYTIGIDNNIADTFSSGNYSGNINYTVTQGNTPPVTVTAQSTVNLNISAAPIPNELTTGVDNDIMTYTGEEGGPFSPGSNQVILSGNCDSDILEDTTLDITFSANENWIVASPSPTPICSNNSYSQTYTISVDNNIAGTFSSGNYEGTINFIVEQNGATVNTSSTVMLEIISTPTPTPTKLDKNEAASYVVGSKTTRAITTKNSSLIHQHLKNSLKPSSQKYNTSISDFTRGVVSVSQYIEQNQDNQMEARDMFSQFLQGSGGLQYGLSAGDGTLQKGIWLNATHIDIDDDGVKSFNADSDLFMLGYDYRFGQLDNMIAGVTLTYAETDAKTSYNSGNLNSDEISITSYIGILYGDSFMLDAQLGYGSIDYDQDRENKTIKSSFDSDKYFMSVNGSLFKRMEQLNLIANFGYLYVTEKQDSYTESKGQSLSSQTLDFGQIYLGGEVNYYINENVEITANIDYLYDTDYVKVSDVNYDRSSIDGGLGLNFYIGESLNANININKIFSRSDDYDEKSYSFNLRYSF